MENLIMILFPSLPFPSLSSHNSNNRTSPSSTILSQLSAPPSKSSTTQLLNMTNSSGGGDRRDIPWIILTVRAQIVLRVFRALRRALLVEDPKVIKIIRILGGRGLSTQIQIKDRVPGRGRDRSVVLIVRRWLIVVTILIVAIKGTLGRGRRRRRR